MRGPPAREERQAGDDGVLCLVSKTSVAIGEERLAFDIAGRFDLAAALILHGRAYFDMLALAGAHARVGGYRASGWTGRNFKVPFPYHRYSSS